MTARHAAPNLHPRSTYTVMRSMMRGYCSSSRHDLGYSQAEWGPGSVPCSVNIQVQCLPGPKCTERERVRKQASKPPNIIIATSISVLCKYFGGYWSQCEQRTRPSPMSLSYRSSTTKDATPQHIRPHSSACCTWDNFASK